MYTGRYWVHLNMHHIPFSAPSVIVFNQRELMILNMIAEGLTNKEIGEKVFSSKRTVDSIRISMLRKSKSRNTAALIACSFRLGILT
ncbi:MAG: hypothetical protein EOO45_00825 [Flavobacterium sp.]|nr:MAG: hypothetical protein EOO45_00825 [Flavobacterium sp.]